MVGVGNVESFHLPEHAGRRISSDDNVVPAVVSGDDAGKVGRHPGRISERTRIAFGVVHIKGPSGNECHFVVGHHFVFRAFGGYDGFVQNLNGLGEVDVEDYFFSGSDDDVRQNPGFVTDGFYLKRLASKWHIGNFEITVHIGSGSDHWSFGSYQNNGSPDHRRLAGFIQNAAPDGLYALCKKRRCGLEKKEKGKERKDFFHGHQFLMMQKNGPDLP